MTQQWSDGGAQRFSDRIGGYDHGAVDQEFARLRAELDGIRAERAAALERIRSTTEELERVRAPLREYDRLHATNPARDPLTCFVRHLVYAAMCEARSIRENAVVRARAIAEKGERAVFERHADLTARHRQAVLRLTTAAEQARRMVNATVRDFAHLLDELVEGRDSLESWIERAQR
ncbi:hypothetical protein [Umezawaea sp. Da 62-37]|uniref:hypothetical protein n=1 Tax=Umezawaea sp. Da 62-37 TaxID=3075927 RepID=UPI0028F721EF|nr:hypothetical protein [Umezawaea sp. Da 62-37]WNV86992.1 hypothetical protein RM788_01495 [Umezawaea sp. Da 62-37]